LSSPSKSDDQNAMRQLHKIEKALERPSASASAVASASASAPAPVAATFPVLLFTGEPVQNRLAGAAVIQKTPQGIKTVAKHTVGWEKTCPPLVAELKAFELAVRHTVGLPDSATSHVWIFSDSLRAI
jgi:hypothetical protein